MDRSPAKKRDPIRAKYFAPLELAEKASTVLFYGAGLLSVLVVLISRADHPKVYEWVHIGFLASALVLFGLDLAIRVYLNPRAHGQRLQDFLSSAYHVNLTHDRSTAYYNNEADTPPKRIVLQVLENCFFSKDTLLRMCRGERILLTVYLILWFAAILSRETPIDFIVVISQTLFSEHLISRLFRIEWLRAKVEKIYEHTYHLIQGQRDPVMLEALAMCNFVSYESAKANAGITLSARIFEKNNSALTVQWEEITKDLPL